MVFFARVRARTPRSIWGAQRLFKGLELYIIGEFSSISAHVTDKVLGTAHLGIVTIKGPTALRANSGTTRGGLMRARKKLEPSLTVDT